MVKVGHHYHVVSYLTRNWDTYKCAECWPAPLLVSGVDIGTFQVWKNTLVAHIAPDANPNTFCQVANMLPGKQQTLAKEVFAMHQRHGYNSKHSFMQE